jgi:hypothetical protein
VIANLGTKVFSDFRGGRQTNVNLATMAENRALMTQNVSLEGDGTVHKRDGYTSFLTSAYLADDPHSMFDWQRDSDGLQFLVMATGNNIWIWKPLTSSTPLLSSSGSNAQKFDFAGNAFSLYMNNGLVALKLVNVLGTETAYHWGLPDPVGAPTVAKVAGTATLKYGRQYVYCYVSKWTDAQGVARYHIGAPSGLSVNSGPTSTQAVAVGNILAPPAGYPEIGFVWVFATVDTPANTSSAYYFAAELTATGSSLTWNDNLTDAQLDITRQAPWDNHPAPLGSIVEEYQSRIAVAGIPGKPDLVQLSGFDEIDLGVPQETFPVSMSFTVPGGSQAVIGAKTFQNALWIGTKSWWFAITGNNATTLRKQDEIIAPGLAGRRAVTATPNHLLWLSPDKRLWAWDGANRPIEVSAALAQPLEGSWSMDDLSSANIGLVELQYIARGSLRFLLVACPMDSTNPAKFPWFQVWNISQLVEDVDPHLEPAFLAEMDFLPSHEVDGVCLMDQQGLSYLILADRVNQCLYRWPDGLNDAGLPITNAVYGLPWSAMNPGGADAGDVVKRFYWADLFTNRDDVESAFRLLAVTQDSPRQSAPLIECGRLERIPNPDPSFNVAAARVSLQRKGLAVGRFIRLVVIFPDDDGESVLSRVSVAYAPVYVAAP